MPLKSRAEALDFAADLVTRARKKGADQADCLFVQSQSLAAQVRNGDLEELEQADSFDIGLRVFVGQSQAIVSSTDIGKQALPEMIERAIAMAKLAPEDPYAGLADPNRLERHAGDLDLSDDTPPNSDWLIEQATIVEATALGHDGITNSEGADASWSMARLALSTSGGFEGAYDTTSFGASCSVLAGEGLGMERDYSYSSARHRDDLMSAEAIGHEAATRTLKRLGATKPKTAKVPVVYDPRLSGSIISALAGAISGGAIARKSSFLTDKIGAAIFANGITIIDDPKRKRGLRSKPFDGEGTTNKALKLVEDGVLKHYLLDGATARQLGLAPNGRASRGTSTPPAPSSTNLYLQAGKVSRDELIGEIKDGFYVTEMMGQGANLVTGDYSRGASGFWIRDGHLAEPVSEVTIAGNLKEMFLNLTPASDLEFRYGINAPTLRIDGMMVAGA